MPSRIDPQEGVQIVYDGECPFCSRFVTLYRAKSVVGRVELIDAREDHPAVRKVKSLGHDLDKGMAVLWEGRIYHGADAISFMAMIGADGDLFNRLNKLIFRVRPLAIEFWRDRPFRLHERIRYQREAPGGLWRTDHLFP